jgi:hypothetical protein
MLPVFAIGLCASYRSQNWLYWYGLHSAGPVVTASRYTVHKSCRVTPGRRRWCLQAFLLRRFYDLGHQLQGGVDPTADVSAVPLMPSSLKPRDLAYATKALEKLREALLKTYESSHVADDSRPPTQRWVLFAFGALADLCVYTIQDVGRWLRDERSVGVVQFQDDWANATDPDEKQRLAKMLSAISTAAQMSDSWQLAFQVLPDMAPVAPIPPPWFAPDTYGDAMSRALRRAADDHTKD